MTDPRTAVANIIHHMLRNPKWNDLYMGGLNEIARRNPSCPVMDWTFSELFVLPERHQTNIALLEEFLEYGYLRLLCHQPYIRDHLTDEYKQGLRTQFKVTYVVQADLLDSL
jgi:hypothetical protein